MDNPPVENQIPPEAHPSLEEFGQNRKAALAIHHVQMVPDMWS